MRILVLTTMYPPHHYGGYELQCAAVVEGFRRHGHEVLVLTSDIQVDGAVHALESTASVRRVLRLYWNDHEFLRPSWRGQMAIERWNRDALDAAFDEFHPDLVSVWQLGGASMQLLSACADRRVPMVYTVCDDWLIYGPKADPWTRRWSRAGPLASSVERILGLRCRLPNLPATGTFCFVSDFTRREAERRSQWSFPDAEVVYAGISTEDFPLEGVAARRSWSGRLLCAGRIDRRKGVRAAIRALTHLPECTLHVLGRGDTSELAVLTELVSRLDLETRVHFAVATREELRTQYLAADAVLFTPTWDEPFGMVPLEAMACATPVVTTATGGSAEFLLDGVNCVGVPIDDDEAIAAAVTRLADDPELRARLVAAGRATAAALTMSQCVDRLHEWHVAAAAGFRSGRPAGRPSIRGVLARQLEADPTARPSLE